MAEQFWEQECLLYLLFGVQIFIKTSTWMNVFIFKSKQTKDEFIKRMKPTLSNNDYIQWSKLTLKWYTHMYQTETSINKVLILTVFPLSDYKNPFPYMAKSPSC